MIDAAITAFSQVLTPPFRSILWRSLGITIAGLIAIWFGLQALLGFFVEFPWPWLETILAVVAGFGLVIGMSFLIAPISSLVAGLFLDEIADKVEASHYPNDRAGMALPLVHSMVLSTKFAGLVVLVNIIALLFLLIPGINLIAFFGANGYLLGREYFELAGLRHRSHEEVIELREANKGRVFIAGLIIAGLLAIPILNLLTPLFATTFMVHIYKQAEMRATQMRLAGP